MNSEDDTIVLHPICCLQKLKRGSKRYISNFSVAKADSKNPELCVTAIVDRALHDGSLQLKNHEIYLVAEENLLRKDDVIKLKDEHLLSTHSRGPLIPFRTKSWEFLCFDRFDNVLSLVMKEESIWNKESPHSRLLNTPSSLVCGDMRGNQFHFLSREKESTYLVFYSDLISMKFMFDALPDFPTTVIADILDFARTMTPVYTTKVTFESQRGLNVSITSGEPPYVYDYTKIMRLPSQNTFRDVDISNATCCSILDGHILRVLEYHKRLLVLILRKNDVEIEIRIPSSLGLVKTIKLTLEVDFEVIFKPTGTGIDFGYTVLRPDMKICGRWLLISSQKCIFRTPIDSFMNIEMDDGPDLF